jgi:uncharacterized SAM-binding protein YcdF (DUF218 family)
MTGASYDDELDRTGLAALVAHSTGEITVTDSSSVTGEIPTTDGQGDGPEAGMSPGDDPTPVGGVPVLPGPRSHRPHRWRRRTIRMVLLLLVAAVTYYAVTVFQVWATGRSDQTRPVGAIVVMGAAQYDGRPSPQLQSRLDHAIDLWRAGLSPIVVVTGGKLPGDRFTEADASARYLTDRGVPDAAILREEAGHNSYDSLVGVSELLSARAVDTVLLVSDPYHSLRIRLIAQELGLTAYVSPTRTSPVQGRALYLREVEEAAGIAVGRIIGFRRLLVLTG